MLKATIDTPTSPTSLGSSGGWRRTFPSAFLPFRFHRRRMEEVKSALD